MSMIPPPERPDKSAATPTHPDRVAEAHRRHHEAQVGLSCGEPKSLAADEAEADYRYAVADANAAKSARIQEFVEVLRLLAGDETGLRELAGRHLNATTGAVPAGTFAVLENLIRAVVAVRQQVAVYGIELVAVDGRAGVRLDRIEAALAAAGIAVKS